MSKTRELAKNTVIILISKLCTQFISFLILPIYTAKLSSDEYGTIDLVNTYTALAIPIIGIQLEMAAFRFLIDSRNNKNKQSTIISSSFLAIITTAAASSIIYIIIAKIIGFNYTWIVLASALTTMISSYLLQVSRGLGDNIAYSIGSLLTGATTILLNLFFILVCDMKIEGVLLSSILANLINIIFIFLKDKIYKLLRFKNYKKKQLQELIHYSSPLVPNSLIWWIINASDRTIISIFMDVSANGIYAVANKFSTIIVQFYGVFILSWTESSSLHIDDDDRDIYFNKIFDATIKIFSCLSLLLLAFMPFVFDILIERNYAEAYLYIPVLTTGTFFNVIASFIGAIYVAKKKTKEIANTSLYAGIINIAINIMLIKTIGLWAAAISTALSFMAMSIYRFINIQKDMHLRLNIKLIAKLICLFSICIASYYTNNRQIQIINLILIIISSLKLNSVTIKSVAKALRMKFIG